MTPSRLLPSPVPAGPGSRLRPLAAGMLALTSLALGAQTAGSPRIELGFEERIRIEDWDNIVDHRDALADYRTQWRFRTRLWTTWSWGDTLQVSAGLNNENRKIRRPDMSYHGRQVFFETLYLDWKFTKAWSVRVGRQNLMRGEGFILFDGNALDGSRSAYFNALDLAWSSGPSKLEFLAISNPGRDQYLPRLNEPTDPKEYQRLTEWNEKALGVYFTTTLGRATGLEAYGFHKTEAGDYRAPAHALFQPDRRVDTVGARVVQPFGTGYTFSAEAALQRGTQDPKPGSTSPAVDIRAWGGYARLKKAFDVPGKPSLSAAYIGLSGDDPATTAVEAWDPLFSRWPKWSELFIYSQGPEKGPGYWTNTGMWELEARWNPWKPLNLRATWYRLDAYHAQPGTAYGPGKRRGDLLQVRADLALGTAWKAHGVYEHLAPGTFYAGPSGGHFYRLEVSYLFKQVW